MARKKKIKQFAAGELGFDMTPMIDVVFQLIIFFMVALSFVETQARAKLILPVADHAKPPEKADTDVFILNVVNTRQKEIDAAGKEVDVFPDGRAYYYNGEAYSRSGVQFLLEKAAQRSRGSDKTKLVETVVIIRGDRDTEWSVMLETLGMCQAAGFSKIYLKANEKELE